MKRASIVAAGIGIIASGILLSKTVYTVTRVIDGDTFETKEKQYIRINGINAPEASMCGAEDSKKALEKLILGKRVFLKVVYFDAYKRLISNVYMLNGKSIAKTMAKNGQAIVDQKSVSDPELIASGAYAREHALGLHTNPCTQDVNTDTPSCRIKGNVRDNSKIYIIPGCQIYSQTKVQKYNGDRWFCTEKEANTAGFVRAKNCDE